MSARTDVHPQLTPPRLDDLLDRDPDRFDGYFTNHAGDQPADPEAPCDGP